MARRKIEQWTVCRVPGCRLLFKLDDVREIAALQAERRLCPMHDTLAYIGSLAAMTLSPGPPAKGTTWT